MALWRGAVDRSRAAVAEAFARDGLDILAAKSTHWGATLSLRRIVADLIDEYARHTVTPT
jgi:hypothetical protein